MELHNDLLGAPPSSTHLSRLVAAAVVSQSFRKLLLDDATSALKLGYEGQCFELSDEERALVLSIRADSLEAFAEQLTKGFSQDEVAKSTEPEPGNSQDIEVAYIHYE